MFFYVVLLLFFNLRLFQPSFVPSSNTIRFFENMLDTKLSDLQKNLDYEKEILQISIKKNKFVIKIDTKVKNQILHNSKNLLYDCPEQIVNILSSYLEKKNYVIKLKHKKIFKSQKEFNNVKKSVCLGLNQKYKEVVVILEENDLAYCNLDEESINCSEYIEISFKYRQLQYLTFIKQEYFLVGEKSTINTFSFENVQCPLDFILKYSKYGTAHRFLEKILSEGKTSYECFRVFLNDIIKCYIPKFYYKDLFFHFYKEIEFSENYSNGWLRYFVSFLDEKILESYLEALDLTINLNFTQKEKEECFTRKKFIGKTDEFIYKFSLCFDLIFENTKSESIIHILYHFFSFFLNKNSKDVNRTFKRIVKIYKITIDEVLDKIYKKAMVDSYKVLNAILVKKYNKETH